MWFRVIRAARWMAVEPWALSQQPIDWLNYAEAAMTAEAKAEEAQRRRQERRQKRG